MSPGWRADRVPGLLVPLVVRLARGLQNFINFANFRAFRLWPPGSGFVIAGDEPGGVFSMRFSQFLILPPAEAAVADAAAGDDVSALGLARRLMTMRWLPISAASDFLGAPVSVFRATSLHRSTRPRISAFPDARLTASALGRWFLGRSSRRAGALWRLMGAAQPIAHARSSASRASAQMLRRRTVGASYASDADTGKAGAADKASSFSTRFARRCSIPGQPCTRRL